MPPDGKLTDAEIADLAAWVKRGAPFPATAKAVGADPAKHWAFQPVGRPDRSRSRRMPTGAKSDLDRFVLAKLEAAGLKPAPPADKRTLIRRVTFDLTGLPPTPEEIDAFLEDDSPDAFAKVVDRLLASPAYGERWGRHWLDVARYADSNGLDENVAHGNAWRYRDYVVAALQRRQAVRPVRPRAARRRPAPGRRRRDARTSSSIATGFLALGPKVLAEVGREEDGDGHRRRAARHARPGGPRPDARLRPLPRPQVRPDPAATTTAWPASSTARRRWSTSRRSPGGTRTRSRRPEEIKQKAEHDARSRRSCKEQIKALTGEDRRRRRRRS